METSLSNNITEREKEFISISEGSETDSLITRAHLIKEPFSWMTILSDFAVTSIMSFSIFYFILGINEVANSNVKVKYGIINNRVEFCFITITFVLIILHLRRFRWNRNCFQSIPINNFPMLFVMVLCALIDIGYYFMNFVSIAIKCFDYTRLLSTISELLFVSAFLPFVIICMCNNVKESKFVMRIKIKITFLFVMGTCLVIFMRKVFIKIEKDFNGTSFKNCFISNDYQFIHENVSKVESILELVDMNFILIGFIFMIDPYRRTTNSLMGKKYINTISITTIQSMEDFLKSLSLIRFRWISVVLSIVLVVILLVASFIIMDILNSELNLQFKLSSYEIFIWLTIVTYIIAILYSTYYYFFDIKKWPKKDNVQNQNDNHFSIFSSSFQIIYSAGMLLSIINMSVSYNIIVIQILDNLFLAFQVLIQSCCINSAIRRKVTCNRISTWKSRLYPSIVLALINFAFVIISMDYSKDSTFLFFMKGLPYKSTLFIVIKDIALPVTILNRLHGMAFFIHLSIEQWQ